MLTNVLEESTLNLVFEGEKKKEHFLRQTVNMDHFTEAEVIKNTEKRSRVCLSLRNL